MSEFDTEKDAQQVEPLGSVEAVEPEEETVVAATPAASPELVAVETANVIAHKRSRNVYAGMWGPIEIGAVSAGALALLFSFFVYFFFVVPSGRELAHNKSESERLSAELTSANSKYGEITTTEGQVNKILASVDDFETRFLPTTATGQSALYQRLNGLIHGYDLVNTTGPDYAPLETVDAGGNQTEEEKGRSKYRSLYPGVYVTMTVEGSYQNLRRFIREVETGREFVIISAIELAPSDNQDQGKATQANVKPINKNPITMGPGGKLVQQANPAVPAGPPPFVRPRGKAHGEYLALHLEMAAYFRRPGGAPLSVDSVEQ